MLLEEEGVPRDPVRFMWPPELLAHVIVLDERRLKRLLTSYVGSYNTDRVHERTRRFLRETGSRTGSENAQGLTGAARLRLNLDRRRRA